MASVSLPRNYPRFADRMFWSADTLQLEELLTYLTSGSFALVYHLQQTSGQGVSEEFP